VGPSMSAAAGASPAAAQPEAAEETPKARPSANVKRRYQKVALQSQAREQADLGKLLQPLLSPMGGVEDISKFAAFQQLLAKEDELHKRYLLLAIMNLTTNTACHKQFVDNDGLVTLNTWLLQARDTGTALPVNERNDLTSFAKNIITALDKLPVTIESLSKSQLGKTVKSLIKTTFPDGVKSAAKALVNKWKGMFIKPAADSQKAGQKRERDGEGAAPSAAKKEKSDKLAGQGKGGGAPRLALKAADDDSLFASRKAAPRPKAAVPAVVRRRVQKLEVPGDGDKGDGLLSPKAGESPKAGGEDASTPFSSAQPEGSADSPDEKDPAGEVAPEESQVAGPTAPTETKVDVAGPKVTNLAAPPKQMARLPVTIKVTLNPTQRTAAQRAAEAAAKIPDSEPDPAAPKKAKAKTVSFRAVREFEVRLFRKEMPPQAAAKDDMGGDDEEVLDPDSPRAGFESASRREHMAEAEANEHVRSHPEEGQEEAQLLAPGVAWEPPPALLLGPEHTATGRGEDSLEAPQQLRREAGLVPSLYSGGLSQEHSPKEPMLLSKQEREALQQPVPSIPWAVEEPAAPAQPAAPQAVQALPAGAPAGTGTSSVLELVSQMDPALLSQLQAMTSGAPAPTPAASQAPPAQPGWERPHAPPHAPPPDQGQAPPPGFANDGWGTTLGPPPAMAQQPPPGGDTSWRALGDRAHGGSPPPRGGGRRHERRDSGWDAPRASGWDRPGGERRGSGDLAAWREEREREGRGRPAPGPGPGGWDRRPGPGVDRRGGGDRDLAAWREEREREVGRLGASIGWRQVEAERPSGPRGPGGPPPPSGPVGPPPSGKACLFFNTPKGCRNGAACKFAHVEVRMKQDELVSHISAISKRPPPREVQYDQYHPATRRRLD